MPARISDTQHGTFEEVHDAFLFIRICLIGKAVER
jgi:hypothetical protein